MTGAVVSQKGAGQNTILGVGIWSKTFNNFARRVFISIYDSKMLTY